MRDAHRAVEAVVDHQPRRADASRRTRGRPRPGSGGASPGGAAMPPSPLRRSAHGSRKTPSGRPGWRASRSSDAAYRLRPRSLSYPFSAGSIVNSRMFDGSNPGVHALEVPHRVDQQSRGRDEEHRERDLHDDERAGQADAPPRSHRPARAFLQSRRQRDVGRAKRGDEAEQDAAHAGHERGERPDPPIERHVEAAPAPSRPAPASARPQSIATSAIRAPPPIDREQQAFGQQLPHDARARRPDRDAHRHFAARARVPVRAAGSPRWRTRRAARSPPRCPSSAADRSWPRAPSSCPRAPGRRSRRGRSDALQRRPSGGDALLHQEIERRLAPGPASMPGLRRPIISTHQNVGFSGASFRVCLNEPAPHRERQRHVRRVADLQRAFEPARGDARDRHRDAVDDERLADRVGRPREAPLPVTRR